MTIGVPFLVIAPAVLVDEISQSISDQRRYSRIQLETEGVRQIGL